MLIRGCWALLVLCAWAQPTAPPSNFWGCWVVRKALRPYHSEPTHLRGRLKRGMTMLVWHRHSCRCLHPPQGRLGTGKSACATQFWRR